MPLPPDNPIRTLTPRQATVYTLARQHPEGITATDAGHAWHHTKGCPWCPNCAYMKTDGLSTLRALKQKGLVRLRKGGTWQAVTADSQAEREPDPMPGLDGEPCLCSGAGGELCNWPFCPQGNQAA